MPRRSLIGAVLIGTLLLAGCSGGDPDTVPDTDSGTSTTEAPGVGAAAECLIGDWLLTTAELQRWVNVVFTPGELQVMNVKGTSTFSFTADGGYRLTPEWGFEVQVAATDMTGSATIAGVLSGTHSVDGDILTTNVTDSAIDATVVIVVSGVAIPTATFEELLEESFGEDPLNSAPFSCSGDSLTLGFDTGHDRMEMDLVRV